MPNEGTRSQWTEAGLKARITGCTKKIGEATRNQDDSAANILRERRASAMSKLASKFNVWTLINPEGKTEFVDRAEWEQRMIAWGRRQGAIPRPRVNLSSRRPETPPTPPQTPPNPESHPDTPGGAEGNQH